MPKVHRLSIRNLGTGNITETVKTKGLSIVSVLQHYNNKKYVFAQLEVVHFAQLLYHGVDVFNLYILL